MAIKVETATKEEAEMVRNFFQATGGSATVNVIRVDEKTVLVGISGYQFTLPVTEYLRRKGLLENGFRAEVHVSKNHHGLSYSPCDPAAAVIETDGVHLVLLWRNRYYLLKPTDCPFGKKSLLYEISQYRRGRLNQLFRFAKRFCGNFPPTNLSAQSVAATPDMIAETEKSILPTWNWEIR